MKIAVLCGTSFDDFQKAVLKPIMVDETMEKVVAYIDCRPRPSFKKRFFKNLKRGRGGYMLIMFFKSLFSKRKLSVSSETFFESFHVPCIKSIEPYSEDSISQLKSFDMDVMVLLGGFGIVKEPLLSLAPKGILSYHHGNMRKYRGQPVGFWELFNGENEMGVTVQKLAAGIDKGMAIVEMTIPIEKHDGVRSLRERALISSINMMHEALHLIDNPDFIPVKIDAYGPVYTIPNFRQFLKLQFRLLFRK